MTARSTHAPSTANGSVDEGSDSEVDQMSPFDVSMARCGGDPALFVTTTPAQSLELDLAMTA